MSSTKEQHEKLIALIEKVLQREGFTQFTQQTKPNQNGEAADFAVTSPEGERWAGEVRVYRSAKIDGMLAGFAVKKLRSYLYSEKAKRGLLIFSSTIPRLLVESLDFGNSLFKIWDYPKLKLLLQKYPDLDIEFVKIINELQPFQESRPTEDKVESQASNKTVVETKSMKLPPDDGGANQSVSGAINVSEGDDTAVASGYVLTNSETTRELIEKPLDTRATDYQVKLRASEAGKDDGVATDFEELCFEIVKFLFEGHLSNWQDQEDSDTKLHRFDVIARITSENEFWLTLQNHFKAKYIIFEFKNYTKKITQKEIYTTEKYLYLPAMRSVAIIISREGANDNALSAARGALREHGKIILNLSIEQICGLLKLIEDGKNASEGMITILDEMLMHIER
jgi:hypothetical protein